MTVSKTDSTEYHFYSKTRILTPELNFICKTNTTFRTKIIILVFSYFSQS